MVVQRRDLVAHAVGYVRARGCPRVRSHDHAAIIRDSHNCRLESGREQHDANSSTFSSKASNARTIGAHTGASRVTYTIGLGLSRGQKTTVAVGVYASRVASEVGGSKAMHRQL